MARLTQDNLLTLLSERRLKMTPQRRAIVSYLAETDIHPTAEEVFTEVNDRFPMTSRATVYNTLNLLVDAHLVSIVEENGVKRFDSNLEPHHHFICTACGDVEDIEPGAISSTSILNPGGRKTTSVEITLRGLCARCAGRTAS